MLPITRANLNSFCRICLRDISNVKETVLSIEDNSVSNRICTNCCVKLDALRQFRCKAIVATGVLRVIVDEETLKSANTTSTLSKLKSICRLCLKGNKLENHNIKEENLANEIFECTGLNVIGGTDNKTLVLTDVLNEDQFFPDKLCSKCHATLKSFIEFRKISEQTADYLRNVFDDAVDGKEIPCVQNMREEVQKLLLENTANNGKELPLGENFVDDSSAQIEECFRFLKADIMHKNLDGYGNNYSSETSPIKKPRNIQTNLQLEANNYFTKNNINEAIYFCSSSENELESNEDFIKNNEINEEDPFDTQCKNFNEKNSELIKDSHNGNNSNKINREKVPKAFQKAFKCIECNKSFYKKFMYEAHVKSVHENIEKPFSCQHCSSSFRLVQVLNRHVISCHENTELRKPCHICLRCQKTFKRKEHLKEHIRAVHEKLKPFQCSVCNKAFGTKNTKMRHERNHSNDKPFSCEYCAKRYNSESELKVHIQRHISKPELLCPICKRAKPTAEELQKHISTHNCSYQCSTCGKVFKKIFHLREHESTVHLKLASLKCSFCDLCFTIRKTLKNHEKSHNEIGRPEKCPLCNLNFKSKRALSLHTKKVHIKES